MGCKITFILPLLNLQLLNWVLHLQLTQRTFDPYRFYNWWYTYVNYMHLGMKKSGMYYFSAKQKSKCLFNLNLWHGIVFHDVAVLFVKNFSGKWELQIKMPLHWKIYCSWLSFFYPHIFSGWIHSSPNRSFMDDSSRLSLKLFLFFLDQTWWKTTKKILTACLMDESSVKLPLGGRCIRHCSNPLQKFWFKSWSWITTLAPKI